MRALVTGGAGFIGSNIANQLRREANLLREGFVGERIYVTGNPIKQVMEHYGQRICPSSALEAYEVQPGQFFLVTMHRAENVDVERRLRELVDALARLHSHYGYPVVCSFHPRTRARVEKFGVDVQKSGLRLVEPVGFFDFVRLEREAFCVLSDSGTVQEEACILGVPNVTIRDVTERPETIGCGSNVLVSCDAELIERMVRLVTERRGGWRPPLEYTAERVAETVLRIVLGYRPPDLAEQAWKAR